VMVRTYSIKAPWYAPLWVRVIVVMVRTYSIKAPWHASNRIIMTAIESETLVWTYSREAAINPT